ncbi:MAG: hypothetical protein OHK0046_06430 [Anaerolineae bacterium]
MAYLPGFRFRREIDVLPWLKINISKTGVSASIGPEDIHITTGTHGTYIYSDVPGKGTWFRRKLGPFLEDLRGGDDDDSDKAKSSRKSSSSAPADEAQTRQEEINTAPPQLNFLERMVMRPTEINFVDALNHIDKGDYEQAYIEARQSANTADGAFLAGFLALRQQAWQDAIEYFERALELRDDLGTLFAEYHVDMRVDLPITEEFLTTISPSRRGCLLALAEAHQQLGNKQLAIDYLHQLQEEYGNHDLMINLLLAELYDQTYADDPEIQHQIVALAEGVRNESPIHAALMFYHGRALRRLEVLEGARETLTEALRRKKDYPSDLLVGLRYERALVYEKMGSEKKAQKEFEKIYALSPNYANVADRIGVVDQLEEAEEAADRAAEEAAQTEPQAQTAPPTPPAENPP